VVVPFPQDWCNKAGDGKGEFTGTAIAVASEYYFAQFGDCRTTGLTASFSMNQGDDWFGYLVSFTLAMAGCPLVYGDIPDGIRAFGPANTGVIGVQPAPLGRDDVDLLIAQYVEAFGSGLALTSEERAAVSAYLLKTAQPFMSTQVQAALSQCVEGDAGP